MVKYSRAKKEAVLSYNFGSDYFSSCKKNPNSLTEREERIKGHTTKFYRSLAGLKVF